MCDKKKEKYLKEYKKVVEGERDMRMVGCVCVWGGWDGDGETIEIG